MNLETLFNLGLGAAISAIGWFVKLNHAKMRELEFDLTGIGKALTDHKVEAARSYVTKPDLERLEHKIDRVLDKLDQKADKP